MKIKQKSLNKKNKKNKITKKGSSYMPIKMMNAPKYSSRLLPKNKFNNLPSAPSYAPTESENQMNHQVLVPAEPENQMNHQVSIPAGVDLDIQNEYGYTGLMRACYNGNKDIVELLINAGVDLNIQNKNG